MEAVDGIVCYAPIISLWFEDLFNLELILAGYWMVCLVLHSNTGVCSLVVTLLETFETATIYRYWLVRSSQKHKLWHLISSVSHMLHSS